MKFKFLFSRNKVWTGTQPRPLVFSFVQGLFSCTTGRAKKLWWCLIIRSRMSILWPFKSTCWSPAESDSKQDPSEACTQAPSLQWNHFGFNSILFPSLMQLILQAWKHHSAITARSKVKCVQWPFLNVQTYHYPVTTPSRFSASSVSVAQALRKDPESCAG